MSFDDFLIQKHSLSASDNEYVQRIITNAVRCAKPADFGYEIPEGAPMMTYKPIDEFKN